VLFRDQKLSDGDLIGFSRRFGTLDQAPIQENGRRFVEGFPEIYVVSNVVENGVEIGSLGAGEPLAHRHVLSARSAQASALYALEVPSSGGDTSFCSMYGAWEALPTTCARTRCSFGSSTTARTTAAGTSAPASRQATTRAPRRHVPSLVCTHPETGRRHFYLGRRPNAWLEECLSRNRTPCSPHLGAATRFADVASPVGVGDLGLWDNRCSCTAVMRSTREPGASCIARRSKS